MRAPHNRRHAAETAIPDAAQTEHDLAAAAVSSAKGARLVSGLVDLDAVYDHRIPRVIEAAVALPTDLDVDVSRYDDGQGLLGAHLVVHGQAVTDTLLRRVVAVANTTGEPVTRIAAWVVDLPCNPSAGCIGRMAQEVQCAAELRAALKVLRAAELALLEGTPVVEALVAVTGLLP